MPIASAFAGAAALAALLGSELPGVSSSQPFGYVGAAILAAISAYTLFRAGSVRAWKETAEARDERIGDLEKELAELRAELAIPERLEGIVRLMADTATHADQQANARLDRGLDRVDERWASHNEAAERRTERMLEAIHELAQRPAA